MNFLERITFYFRAWVLLSLAVLITTTVIFAAPGDLDFVFNPGPDQDVFAILTQPDGKILIGGDFTTLRGAARNRIARLNVDGTVDKSFDPGNGATARV